MADNAEIFERLSRIEQTMARVDERTKTMVDNHSDHERRIRALERDNDKRKGGLAVVGTLGGIIGTCVTWLLKSVFGGNS